MPRAFPSRHSRSKISQWRGPGSTATDCSLARRVSVNARASSTGSGVAKMRGCVTIRRKPLRTMLETPKASWPSTSDDTNARWSAWPYRSGRKAQTRTFTSGRTIVLHSVQNVKNRSKTLTAQVEVPEEGGQGVILAQGGRFGGWSLHMDQGRPIYTYNFLGLSRYTVAGEAKIPLPGHECQPVEGRVRRHFPISSLRQSRFLATRAADLPFQLTGSAGVASRSVRSPRSPDRGAGSRGRDGSHRRRSSSPPTISP